MPSGKEIKIFLPNQPSGRENSDFLTWPAVWWTESRFPYQTCLLVRKFQISLPNSASGKENWAFLSDSAGWYRTPNKLSGKQKEIEGSTMHFAYSLRVENMFKPSSQHGWPRNATDTMCNESQDFLPKLPSCMESQDFFTKPAVFWGELRFPYQTCRLMRKIKILAV